MLLIGFKHVGALFAFRVSCVSQFRDSFKDIQMWISNSYIVRTSEKLALCPAVISMGEF